MAAVNLASPKRSQITMGAYGGDDIPCSLQRTSKICKLTKKIAKLITVQLKIIINDDKIGMYEISRLF